MRPLYFSKGTLQQDRATPALLPTYVAVDEKTVSDYLVFVQEYAQLVRYWNTQNNPQGNWQIFFKEDLSLLLAYIGHIDVGQYPQRHDQIATTFQQTTLENEKEQTLVQLLELNLNLTYLIKDWYEQIVQQGKQEQSSPVIEQTIEELVQANIEAQSVFIEDCYKSMWIYFQEP
ncbi:MAG: hypothetical protein AAGD05_02080, partial [Bacteroidota bacterium]